MVTTQYDEAADAAHEVAVAAFFKQAVLDGRMTQEECDDLIGIKRHGRGRRHSDVKDLKVFEDFVVLACNDDRPDDAPGLTERQKAAMRVRIDIRLAEMHLTRRHVELYINYPKFTETELGKAFGMPRTTVEYMLARVRKSWPSFRTDVEARDRDECPALKNMERIECSDTTDWLDENAIRQKF